MHDRLLALTVPIWRTAQRHSCWGMLLYTTATKHNTLSWKHI